MVALSVQTFAPNVYLLVLLALLDRLVLSPVIARQLGGKGSGRATEPPRVVGRQLEPALRVV